MAVDQDAAAVVLKAITWKPFSSTHTGKGPGGTVLLDEPAIGTVTNKGSFTGRISEGFFGRCVVMLSFTTVET